MEVWCGLSPGGFPPGRREQEAGFLFAWENRSSAWAHTRKEPRACETQERKRHGARLARRRRAPGINRVRARHGNETNPVRDLLTAGALLAGLAALRAANRRLTWETPEKPRSRAQLFGRFCALGTRRSFSLPGKTGAQRGHAPGKNRVRARLKCRHKHGARLAHRRCACVRDAGRKETRCAACPAQPRDLLAAGAGLRRTFSSYLSPFSVWLLPLNFLFICRSGRDGPLLSSEKKVDKDSQKGFAPSNPIPVPCGRSPLFPRCWPA